MIRFDTQQNWPRRAAWLLAAPALVWFAGSGCTGSFSAAVGPNQDLTLVTDFPVGDDRTALVRELFGHKIETPLRPEARFRVEPTDSSGFETRRDWRNFVILSDFAEPTWGTRTVRRIFGDERVDAILTGAGHGAGHEAGHEAGLQAGYLLTQDVWADGQTVLFIHAPSKASVRALIEREGEAIVERYEDHVIDGLTKTMFLGGEQTAMVDGIERALGYRLRIPEDYVVEWQAENRFLRIKTMEANGAMLWLFVYFQEQTQESLDPNLAMGLRDKLTERYYGGDQIDASRSEVRRRTFAGHEALEVFGLYQNLEPPMGGLFKLIAFHEGGRLYLIDMAVFNPPGDKIPLLRKLEAIARTLEHTGEVTGEPVREPVREPVQEPVREPVGGTS